MQRHLVTLTDEEKQLLLMYLDQPGVVARLEVQPTIRAIYQKVKNS